MLKINTVLIDDEIDALDILDILLKEYSQINIIKKITNPIEVFPLIIKEKIDLIFLDIQMPQINGLELIEKIKTCCPGIAVIFVSAYSNFTQEAIKHNTFDYLLKPVCRKELKLSISKIEQYIESKLTVSSAKILLNSKNETIFINPYDVILLQANGNYTRICLNDGSEHIASYNMGAIVNKFPINSFVRVNRSLMVNKNFIVSVNRKLKKCTINYNNEDLIVDASSVFIREVNVIF